MSETICAIATAIVPQQGSVGIVRLSGDEAQAIAARVFRAAGKQRFESHRIHYGHFVAPDGTVIDECLMLLMAAPRSFTREDVVEFHCHGGIAVVQQILRTCIEQGARLARRGEFTLRAFLNGRIDLTRAEAVAELVAARSPEAAQVAVAGLQGKLAQQVGTLRNRCLELLAQIEARLDFEDDLPPLDEGAIKADLAILHAGMRELIATASRGELLRTGLKVAIVGRPNVGKSSLLNAWSRVDRAIVTELPGTTRDLVESMLNLQGIPLQVLDTAGIREAQDKVEQLGIERSRSAARTADLVLLVIDRTEGWTCADSEIFAQLRDQQPPPLIVVVNKSDLEGPPIHTPTRGVVAQVATAAAWGQGIAELEAAILSAIGQQQLQLSNSDLAINERHHEALVRAEAALSRVDETLVAGLPLDFWTIDLRTAAQALGEITGQTVTEAVLDRIFSKFCIGK
ncbi:tRNA uridine-5-carboxymethylaminomethyl(34) synthesis GTPase MnmE [Gloeobacter kilaueensis]|uniref:tRNA modification GTPase MnmE n=1 Tax=Gloeobacter kilaueensis (strain ATCC BAA-2537 / CCAP 1431/1 / ULC 316 / JS1) TaxID=1183438 RepID=U5QJ46_GLOK1|nr:tRNA uridine-5-carboxymethylaminomethyl(34) synthesis GTPase MnmE [Gloeobacter kilaueensis]AGY59002.1 tRNA modification GTPase TrmE [Gloeobacter kilaueensis JS1]